MRTLLLTIGLILLSSNVTAQVLAWNVSTVTRHDQSKYYHYIYLLRVMVQKEQGSNELKIRFYTDSYQNVTGYANVKFYFEDGSVVEKSIQYKSSVNVSTYGATFRRYYDAMMPLEFGEQIKTKRLAYIDVSGHIGIKIKHKKSFAKAVGKIVDAK